MSLDGAVVDAGQCVCRALGTLGARGMPVAVDLFRRAFVTSRLNGVYRPFPPRTESSGQREQASVSRTTRTRPTLSPGNCAMQRTTPWLTAILRGPSGMNTGSDYYFDGTGPSGELDSGSLHDPDNPPILSSNHSQSKIRCGPIPSIFAISAVAHEAALDGPWTHPGFADCLRVSHVVESRVE